MKQLKITVIVPVYNSEKYIKKCIESIISQHYSNYELIIINDGSTDNSLKLLSDYSLNPHVKIITTENNGAAYARNLGIRNATGEYIIFVDSDDYIAPNALKVICKKVKYSQPDMLMFSADVFNGAEEPWHKWAMKCKSKMQIGESCRDMPIGTSGSVPFIWNKAYSRKFLLNNLLSFPEITLGEDQSFLFNAYQKATKVLSTAEALYHYRVQRKDSIMHKYKNNHYLTSKEHLKLIKTVYFNSYKNMLTNTQLNEVFQWGIELLYHNAVKKLSQNEAIQISKEFQEIINFNTLTDKLDFNLWKKETIWHYNILDALSHKVYSADVSSIFYECDSKILVDEIRMSLEQTEIVSEVIVICFSEGFYNYLSGLRLYGNLRMIYLPNASFEYAKSIATYISSGKYVRYSTYCPYVWNNHSFKKLIYSAIDSNSKISVGLSPICKNSSIKINNFEELQHNINWGCTLFSKDLIQMDMMDSAIVPMEIILKNKDKICVLFEEDYTGYEFWPFSKFMEYSLPSKEYSKAVISLLNYAILGKYYDYAKNLLIANLSYLLVDADYPLTMENYMEFEGNLRLYPVISELAQHYPEFEKYNQLIIEEIDSLECIDFELIHKKV